MPLKILIVGAGVCGPALASFLQSANQGHNITIVERSPSLRLTGQQIDVKNEAVEVMRRMGLFNALKAHRVNETGLEFLDRNGDPMAHFGVSGSDERRVGLTSEYEILRGDLVNILYQDSLERHKSQVEATHGTAATEMNYEFGTTITTLDQDKEGVDVTFSDGKKRRYDVVVAADGQASRTRSLAFGPEVNSTAFTSLGIHGAYYSVPKGPDEANSAKAYSALRSRLIITRSGDSQVSQVLLFAMQSTGKLTGIYKESVEKQKEAFTEVFRDAGWKAEHLLAELKTSTDFYAHELGQIKMPKLYSGRVVLVGDAGYCPSPFSGQGAAGALIGPYLLAGELARQGNNVGGALETYDNLMRPVIKEVQTIPSVGLGLFFPSSRFGGWLLRNGMWAISKLQNMSWGTSPGSNAFRWKLPDYPELNL